MTIYINNPVYGMAWEGSIKGQLCVDLPGKGYQSYDTKDECVNTLYLTGHKELARMINDKF